MILIDSHASIVNFLFRFNLEVKFSFEWWNSSFAFRYQGLSFLFRFDLFILP